MKNKEVSQSTFDYLLMELANSGKRSGEDPEETKIRINHIGYDVGKRLTERFSDIEKAVTTFEDAIKYLTEATWCSSFFGSASCVYTEAQKTMRICVKQSPFVSSISSFSQANEEDDVMLYYLNFLQGVFYGSLEMRGFSVNVVTNILPKSNNALFELVVVLSN
ncbi:hypothetical protein EIN_230130 [Entamoeba invadens IP1]|uniref:Trafficking protein particle complex subunit n=1 Tax=Entamoeba invadens IP1 TaxID=370355 RepID=A0A0A1U6F4_ENTIV|nr:hypothetical protein EIN_230130 [Entamoeba invadens IP1]ELP88460.1 hypothetical protein EIN_230130 [Entamoeba invadens IP1]|eukprot:XP_004255231.1 hypothetical protein EIN_230130 [Entamoeba invadens IP1]